MLHDDCCGGSHGSSTVASLELGVALPLRVFHGQWRLLVFGLVVWCPSLQSARCLGLSSHLPCLGCLLAIQWCKKLRIGLWTSALGFKVIAIQWCINQRVGLWASLVLRALQGLLLEISNQKVSWSHLSKVLSTSSKYFLLRSRSMLSHWFQVVRILH